MRHSQTMAHFVRRKCREHGFRIEDNAGERVGLALYLQRSLAKLACSRPHQVINNHNDAPIRAEINPGRIGSWNGVRARLDAVTTILRSGYSRLGSIKWRRIPAVHCAAECSGAVTDVGKVVRDVAGTCASFRQETIDERVQVLWDGPV